MFVLNLHDRILTIGQNDAYHYDGPDEYSAAYLGTKDRFEKTYRILEVNPIIVNKGVPHFRS